MTVLHVNGYTTHTLKESDCLVLTCVDKYRNLYRVRIVDERLRPRFYVPQGMDKEIEHSKAILGNHFLSAGKHDVPDRFGRKVTKIVTKFKKDVPEIRDFFGTTYQAAIEWHKMAVIEMGIWEWIDVDLSLVKLGYVDMDYVQPAEDPGWEWEGRTCWLDSEWDARNLNHVPRYYEAKMVTCDIICCIDDYTNEAFTFSTRRDKSTLNQVNMRETRISNKVDIPEKIKEVKRVFATEKEMLTAFVEWFSTRKFDTISGHNTSGGWIVTNKGGRKWRNGFDMPLIHERCVHLGVDVRKLSPLRRVYARINDDRGTYELVVGGVTLFDWLYAWKFTQYGKFQEKIVVLDNGKARKVRLKSNGLDALGHFYFDMGKARGMEELKLFYPDVKEFPIHKWHVWQLHDYYPELSEYYCFQDVVLSWGLDKLHNVKNDVLSVAYFAGAPPEDAMLATRYHKVLTYRLLKEKMVLETGLLSMTREGEEKPGAYVPEAKKGLWIWVLDLDFASMYPNIYKTFNCGMDTIVEPKNLVFDLKNGLVIEDIGGRKHRFDELLFTPADTIFMKHPDSIVRYKQGELGKIRSGHKKERDKHEKGTFLYKRFDGMQKRIKVVMNSDFGVAPVDIFKTATLTGQFLLKTVINFVGPDRCIGGDTDGAHILLLARSKEELVAEAMKIAREVNEHVDDVLKDFGCETNTLFVAVECISDKVLYHAKKMYIERRVWEGGKWLDEPYYHYRGIRIRRSDSSQVMDELIRNVRDIIFESRNDDEARIQVSKYLKKFHKDIRKRNMDDLAVFKSLSRYVDSYGNTMEARAARFTKAYFGKEFLPLETFKVLSMKDYPARINGKVVNKKHVMPKMCVAYNNETFHFLEGMKVDVNEMERKTIKAIDPFMEFLGLKYYKVISTRPGGLFR